MVQFTREDNPIDVPAYLRSHAEDAQYSVISIINDMGLPEQAEYYKTVVERRVATSLEMIITTIIRTSCKLHFCLC